MLPSKRVLSQLLGSLYEAASNPAMWDVFLRDFTQVAQADSAGLLVHDLKDNGKNVARQFGLDPDDVRLYYNESNEIEDIWTRNALPVSHPGWIGLSESLCSSRALLRTPFYNECLKKLHIVHGMFGVIEQSATVLANISIYRSTLGDAFDAADLEILRFFMPHLQRAFQLHFRLTDLQSRNSSLQAAVDMFSTGMIFFDSAGKIIGMNRSANYLLAQRDGLVSSDGRLLAEDSLQSGQLEAAIRQAIATSAGKGLHPGGAVDIKRRSLKSLHVTVIPVRSIDLGTSKGAAAVAFLVDPTQQVRPRTEILRDLFRMTPAECRVAFLLSDGKSLSEIAQILGVSRNTLKTQVASVYSKTGASRQSQLVRLLTQFPQRHIALTEK